MFTKQQKNQYLAIAVALTLGGSLWGGAACTEAADAYTLDAGNPTPDAAHSVPDEGNGPGVAGGFTNAAAALTGKTLTVDGVTYAGIGYGGYNQGGGVTGNHLIIQNGGRLFYHAGNGGDAYGGRADLGGDARGNTVMIDGGTVDRSVYGGYLSLGNVNGSAAGNRVTIKGAASSIDRNVYGGYIRDSDNTGTVTGNIVTIEDGTAQGEILGGYANSESSVTDNKVFIKGGTVQNAIYGGTSTGGAATDNHVTVTGGTVLTVYGGYSSGGSAEKNTVTIDGGTVQKWIYGGYIYNGGSAEGNTVTIKSGIVQKEVSGAYTYRGGIAKGNHVIIEGGTVQQAVYGGYTERGAGSADGSAEGNTVTISGGTVQDVFGASVDLGSAAGNIVTINGGTVHDIWGGFSASGETRNNTVNLGDGTHALAPGTTIGKIYGGNQADVSGNKLNVKANATAENIGNFDKVTFYLRSGGVTQTETAPLLTLTDTAGTTVNLGSIGVDGWVKGKRILMENATAGQLNATAYTGGRHSNFDEKREYHIDTNTASGTATQILYEGMQFKDATSTETATTNAEIYGGRSRFGNSTVGNTLTIENGAHQNAYGGKTEGSGTNLEEGNSRDNTVLMKNGTVNNSIYGGYTAGSGSATGNIVTINGGTVHNIWGGFSSSGEAKNNTVNLGDGTHALAPGTTIGKIYGGNQADVSGNKLNVKANATAENIGNFDKVTFYLRSGGVTQTETAPLLTLTDTAGTTVNLGSIGVDGWVKGKRILMENATAGQLNATAYTGGRHSNFDEKREYHIDTNTASGTATQILYEGMQFKDATSTETATTNAEIYGGRSRFGNSTVGNTLTIENGAHQNAYGGKTEGSGTNLEEGNSRDNTVLMKNGTVNNSIYGGYTAGSGSATGNIVNISGGTVSGGVYGGMSASGNAMGNIVNITGGTVSGVVRGGMSTSGSATGNTVTLGDGTHALPAAALSNADLYGGTEFTGNVLNVKTNVAVKSVQNFETLHFEKNASVNDANPLLKVMGATQLKSLAGIDIADSLLDKYGHTYTLIEGNAINIGDGGETYGKTEEKTEHLLKKVRLGGIDRLQAVGYRFKDADVTQGGNTSGEFYAGQSEFGNSAVGNKLTVTGGTHDVIGGGHTAAPSAFAGADQGESRSNIVTLQNGTVSGVYGGYVAGGNGDAKDNQVRIDGGSVANAVIGGFTAGSGNATGNTVTITGGTVSGDIVGGYANVKDASANIVDLGAVTVSGNVFGGRSGGAGTTNDNTIHLRGTQVSGTVTGGSAAAGTGNTLAVHDFNTSVQDFSNVQNLHFYLPEETTGNSDRTMLRLGVQNKDIRGIHLGVGISGQQSALQKGDIVSLMKVAANGALTTDEALDNDVSGMQGVSLKYQFALQKRSTDELVAIVKDNAVMNEQTKSLVETRSAASAFLNGGADLLSGMGMDAAETAAADGSNAANAAIRSGSYEIWAAQGGSGERIETGSYVDAKGWNLNVGFAKQDAIDKGKLTYGPFVEYGRGSYDSYLDDGTHGDGSSSYIGGGFMVKATGADQSYVEASLHAGRIKSDYSGNISGTSTSYDASNNYMAGHIGLGRKFDLSGDAALEGYAKYFYSRQNGASATLITGEKYDFGSVTSSRVRLGMRYTKKLMPRSEFYAGLAWEYEFDGDATATYEGYATPSPSLKGGSGMLELGYRFTPKGSSVSYGVNLTGWQGKRKGITGGAHVSWAF